MVTLETAVNGTEVIYKDPATGTMQTTKVEGSYIDEKLGLMVKSALFPGGMLADRYFPIDDNKPAETAEVLPEEALPEVTFEVAILDKTDPVKITAALITAESKVLTDLTIKNYLDEKGYEAVKKAKAKAVKTRTAIEAKEKEVLKTIKTRHASELKEVTDYAAELYTACRAVEKNLGDKLTAIDTEKAAEAKKLADAELAKTEGRDAKFFELGMMFNGTAYVGYGRQYTKNSLYSLDQPTYDALVTELEGLQLEQSVTGDVKAAPTSVVEPITGPFLWGGKPTGIVEDVYTNRKEDIPKREYPTAVYDKTSDGTRIVLTRGEIADPEPGAKIVNDRVQQSAIYVQVI